MQGIIWNLFIELRKELLESQKIRAQVLGFKFTFITAALGLICANIEKYDNNILAIPALAAILFDLIIYSYSFSVKRIGSYIKDYIEPVLKCDKDVPTGFVMWQEYLTQRKTVQSLAVSGNIGVTLLCIIVAILGISVDYKPIVSPFIVLILFVFLIIDILAYNKPKKLNL
jgi:hypothetical protein